MKKVLLFLSILGSIFVEAQVYNNPGGTISTCSGTFFDSGGSGGNYSSGETVVTTFCPDVPGQFISVNFTSFQLEDPSGLIITTCDDALAVYDGNSTASPQIGGGVFCGDVAPNGGVVTSTDASGCLTFEFTSDNSAEFSGWEAEINCTDGSCLSTCEAPNVSSLTLNTQECYAGCNIGSSVGPIFDDPDNTIDACFDFNTTATSWYSVTTGPLMATLDVEITSSDLINPYVAIFGGTCDSYILVACQPATGSGTVDLTGINVSVNTDYVIAVGDANGEQGDFNICITGQEDQSACNIDNDLTVTNTSMGSPIGGPYLPGEVVSFCYTINSFMTTTTNCNYLQGIVPTFGNGWDPTSFNGQGEPVITTPLQTAGTIGLLGDFSNILCAGNANGDWSWFPAGSVDYNLNSTNTLGYAAGDDVGAGWFFLSSYDPLSGACTPAPTDPNDSYGDNDFPACADLTGWQVCFDLQVVDACDGSNIDCSVSVKTFADGEIGIWENVGCSNDAVTTHYASVFCCEPPTLSIITPLECNNPNCIAEIGGLAFGQAPYEYEWSDANGVVRSVTNIPGGDILIDACAGWYYLTTTSADGCISTDSIEVLDVPNPDPVIIGVLSYCAADGGTILDAGAGYDIYQWSTGGAGQTEVVTAADNPITVTVTSGTCSDISPSVNVVENNAVTVTLPNVSGCDSVNYQGVWYYFSEQLIQDFSPSSSGCDSTEVVDIVVTPSPTPTASATPDTIYMNNATILSATGGGTYDWGNEGLGQSVEVFPTQSGENSYTVVVSENGCEGEASVTVFVLDEELEIIMPNAFSPNGDGLNDLFKIPVPSSSFIDIELRIYNRWGELVHESNGDNHGWDGHYNGKLQDNDVYKYFITATSENTHEIYELMGEVHLLK